jgi:hypothetical protein
MRTIDRRQRIFLARLRTLEEELLEDEPNLVVVHSAIAALGRAAVGTASLSPAIEGWQVEECVMLLRDLGEFDLAKRALAAGRHVFPEECFITEAGIDARCGDRRRGIDALHSFGTNMQHSSQNRFVAAMALSHLSAPLEVREVVQPLLDAALERNDEYRAELCTALLNGRAETPSETGT